ncbi:hypothetical protein QYE76_027794 [Lolium multiflorum]|uniref:Uncharacterized protein n=1 Tax=Lolium multiflorum TaxID=4521 RepID=A0AAD8QL22_LOLMU|nr:hypothetical protein QYE76_027794 [Lolium multiflorum]
MGAVAEAAMGSVIRKLGDLLIGEHKLFNEAKYSIRFLKAELESIHGFLKKMSDMGEEPDEQTKCWVDEVRELSYDIEDNIYDFLLHSEHESNNIPQHGFRGFIDKCINLLRKVSSIFLLGHHHETIKELQGLKRRVVEASERRTRYKLDEAIWKSNTAIDLRLLALYAETAGLVGIEGPREELIQLIMDEKSVSAGQLKVLSIVGFGGLGKTTLVIQVYRQLQTQFEFQAFISVSQKPNIRKILRRILSQVGYVARVDTHMEIWDEDELIRTLQEYLMNKRYFIVIDDIWDEITWNIIRCALPETMKGAMSKLQRLEINVNAHGWEQHGAPPAGIGKLPCLKEVAVRIGCCYANVSDTRAARSALQNAIDMHAGGPIANIKCENMCFGFEDFGWKNIKVTKDYKFST